MLINMGIVPEANLVKGIGQFYGPPIEKTAQLCLETGKSLREIDKEYFMYAIKMPPIGASIRFRQIDRIFFCAGTAR